jgi:lysophospholipase L1-like esterase
MLDEALISKVTPLLSTVTPACSSGPYDWMNSKVVYHNSHLHALAQEKGVVVVDNYRAILSYGGDRLYEDEKLHFTDEGYEIIAQQWFDALVLNGLLEQPEAEE